MSCLCSWNSKRQQLFICDGKATQQVYLHTTFRWNLSYGPTSLAFLTSEKTNFRVRRPTSIASASLHSLFGRRSLCKRHNNAVKSREVNVCIAGGAVYTSILPNNCRYAAGARHRVEHTLQDCYSECVRGKSSVLRGTVEACPRGGNLRNFPLFQENASFRQYFGFRMSKGKPANYRLLLFGATNEPRMRGRRVVRSLIGPETKTRFIRIKPWSTNKRIYYFPFTFAFQENNSHQF